jgi:hypothetical protein
MPLTELTTDWDTRKKGAEEIRTPEQREVIGSFLF